MSSEMESEAEANGETKRQKLDEEPPPWARGMLREIQSMRLAQEDLQRQLKAKEEAQDLTLATHQAEIDTLKH
eukprot:1014904-Prorocentrum_lima.AAC.1